MKRILKITNPNDYGEYVGAEYLHPLISIVHYDELLIRSSYNNYGVYALFIQKDFPKDLSYGMKPMNVKDGSILAIAPGQVGGREDNGEVLQLNGWAILWSPDLMHNTDIEEKIKEFQYFSYFATEPLKMQPDEYTRISQLISQLRDEIRENEDSTSLRDVILGYLRLIMEYCNRIYRRQQNDSESSKEDILKKFNAILEGYYKDGKQLSMGIPTVSYIAKELAYSPRYFGDIVHKTTGKTAIGYIHDYVINQGKSLLMKGYSIAETAYQLGFEYPHHFTRVFKKVLGMTPSDYINK